MEQIVFDNCSSNNQTWSLDRFQSSRSTARLRSACNACHEAKTKCSGGVTCFACQLAGLQCNYSRISRLGRPKGSKNKRTLRQQIEHDSGENHRRNDSQPPRPQEPHQAKTKGSSDRFTWASDLDHAFDPTFASSYADNALDGLLYPDLNSLIDKSNTKTANPAQADITEYGLDSLFANNPPSTLTPPPYFTQTIENQPHSTIPLPDYVTNTSISPPSDHSISSCSHSSHTAPLHSACTCLQQQVKLVYQLGNLQDLPTLDRVLGSVELAQEPWENLMRCARCHSPDNQKEVFLLFATSIRIIQSSLKKLEPESFGADAPLNTTTCQPALDTSNTNVLVGSFTLTGKAKTEVIAVVIQRALKVVTSASLHLRDRVGMKN
ncbi:hypothetical protein BKA66DRAFT_474401 [Pyrenochaeta sp. MPI-SDFR-AT-0127]|nr:hypothetical protein BKA66DRAFT_474401 [Pyrenochaeta sp. MPI-SDFR-AT-0127]